MSWVVNTASTLDETHSRRRKMNPGSLKWARSFGLQAEWFGVLAGVRQSCVDAMTSSARAHDRWMPTAERDDPFRPIASLPNETQVYARCTGYSWVSKSDAQCANNGRLVRTRQRLSQSHSGTSSTSAASSAPWSEGLPPVPMRQETSDSSEGADGERMTPHRCKAGTNGRGYLTLKGGINGHASNPARTDQRVAARVSLHGAASFRCSGDVHLRCHPR